VDRDGCDDNDPGLVLTPQLVLPARLDDLLNLLRDGLVYPVPVRGATTDCTGYETHDMQLWVTGSLSGRSLRLAKCANCEAVEVRDVSLDLAIGNARLPRRPLNRLLGWYTGRRPADRAYLGRR
jgi:hypothetical protein